jgi:hypothetical protein
MTIELLKHTREICRILLKVFLRLPCKSLQVSSLSPPLRCPLRPIAGVAPAKVLRGTLAPRFVRKGLDTYEDLIPVEVKSSGEINGK